MANLIYQYDPADVTVVHGSHLVDGFAEDEFVTVTMRERDVEMEAGAQGDVLIRRMRNPIGEIRIRLQAESPSNTVLANMREVNTKGILVPVQTIVRDLRKVALHKASVSVIQGAPDAGYASAAGVREWVFLCADLKSFVGGAAQVV